MILNLLLLHLYIHFIFGNQFNYLAGVGKGDITGPAFNTMMMGYAYAPQKSSGIHTRLYARAFIIADLIETNQRVAYVSCDIASIDPHIREQAILRFKQRLNEDASMYDSENIMISATHTHSAPGSYHQHMIYHATEMNYDRLSVEAQIAGISFALYEAHINLRPSNIKAIKGELFGASVNRSPAAFKLNAEYLENPDYFQKYDTDKDMIVLTFSDENGLYSIFNWFPVHGTSMKKTNRLISGDNKGYASQKLESLFQSENPGFVASFAQANPGDSTPNIQGKYCSKKWNPCDPATHPCKFGQGICLSYGPGFDLQSKTDNNYLSVENIGDKQVNKVIQLLSNREIHRTLRGPIYYQYKWIYMKGQEAEIEKDKYVLGWLNKQESSINYDNSPMAVVNTCNPAFGFAFASGTVDGIGLSFVGQGRGTEKPAKMTLTAMQKFLRIGPDSLIQKCQWPKPVLMNGEREGILGKKHYDLFPKQVDLQIFKIGQLVIIAAPAEFTSMVGIRIKNAVREAFGDEDIIPVISGLSNSYSSYTTTHEEYSLQQYEGASTLYGQFTWAIYKSQYLNMVEMIKNYGSSQLGENHQHKQPYMLDGELGNKYRNFPLRGLRKLDPSNYPNYDSKHKQFGKFLKLVRNDRCQLGGISYSATFIGSNPRQTLYHDLFQTQQRISGVTKFMKVYQYIEDNKVLVATDGDWNTIFRVIRPSFSQIVTPFIAAKITVELEWKPLENQFGEFQICYNGHHQFRKGGEIFPHQGCSEKFHVRNVPNNFDANID